jgi:hypothetical protein
MSHITMFNMSAAPDPRFLELYMTSFRNSTKLELDKQGINIHASTV